MALNQTFSEQNVPCARPIASLLAWQLQARTATMSGAKGFASLFQLIAMLKCRNKSLPPAFEIKPRHLDFAGLDLLVLA